MDARKPALLDSFYAYTPTLSPDRRWLIFRRFYPSHGVNASEQYFLYDAESERERGIDRGNDVSIADPAGILVYPRHPNGKPGDNIDLPLEMTHRFRTTEFYWAPDSSAVAFADSVDKNLSIVLVTSGADPGVYTAAISVAEICPGGEARLDEATLSDARIASLPEGDHDVSIEVRIPQCRPSVVLIAAKDFHRAAVEKVTEHQRLPSVQIRK